MTFDPDSFEGKVLTSLTKIEEKVKMLPDHEDRLRKLERYAYILMGGWGILAGWLKIHTWGGK